MATPTATVSDQSLVSSGSTEIGESEIDVPTVVAIATVAWAVANVLHEIAGHAGAALVLGIPVEAVSTTTAFIDWDQIQSATQDRIINAAGVLVNLVTGTVALVLLRYRSFASAALRYFLWLLASMSLVIVVMNLVTAPLMGGGDWSEVVDGLEPRAPYLVAIVIAGLVIAAVGYLTLIRQDHPGLTDRTRHRHLAVVPVITLIVVQSLSLAGSPFATAPIEQNHLVASIFAYLHFAAWALLLHLASGDGRAPPVPLARSRWWLVAGAVSFVFFVFVLGPGLGPLDRDPRLG